MAAASDTLTQSSDLAADRADAAAAPAQGANGTTGRRRAPWRGRKRTEAGEAKDEFIAVRVTGADRERIALRAQESGLKIGGYLRALALGSAGARAVKRPRVEREQLARLLGEIGKLGSNVNQLAKWSNTQRSAASAAELAQIRADIGAMRDAVMKALDRGD